MKFKGIAAAVIAAMSLSAVPSAFAQEVIAPETVISDSSIGNLNQLTSIFSYNFGSGESASDTLIEPITVIEGVDANLINIINTIVNINCNIDLSDMSNMIEKLRADVLSNMSK